MVRKRKSLALVVCEHVAFIIAVYVHMRLWLSNLDFRGKKFGIWRFVRVCVDLYYLLCFAYSVHVFGKRKKTKNLKADGAVDLCF